MKRVNSIKITIFSLLTIFVFSTILIVPTFAAVPDEKFTFQAVLKDSSGNLVSATKDIQLDFYTASTGGTSQYTVLFDDNVVSNGLVTGQVTIPYEGFLLTKWYIGVSVSASDGSGTEVLTPRIEMLSAPYSVATLGAGNNVNMQQKNIFNATSFNATSIEIEQTGTALAANITNTGTGQSLIVYDSAPASDTTPFVIDASGNIGIGTILPDQKISFQGGNFMHNTTNPTLEGAIQDNNKGGSATQIDQARDVFVSGKYAYVVGNLDDSLSIFDISNPANPVEEGTIVDSGATILDGAYAVKVVGKYAYVVSGSAAENGLSIIDISNPNSPAPVGVLTDGTDGAALQGTSGMDIEVVGPYAYITACDSNALNIIDISNPASPSFLGKIVDGGPTLLQCPIGLWVQGKYAYVAARTDNGLEIIDISNPTSPSHVGALADGAGTALDGAFGIWVSGKYAYVTSFDESGLQIIDVSNPASPTAVGKIQDNSAGGSATALSGAEDIFLTGRYAYIGSFGDDGVSVIDVHDPANPAEIAKIVDDASTLLDVAVEVFVSGKFLYVAAAGDDSLSIFDISGLYVPAAHIGNIQSNYVSVTEDAIIGNKLFVQSGLNVGERGIHTDGNMTIAGQLGIGKHPLKTFHVEKSDDAGEVALFTNPSTNAAADGIVIDLNNINTPGVGNCFITMLEGGGAIPMAICGDAADGIKITSAAATSINPATAHTIALGGDSGDDFIIEAAGGFIYESDTNDVGIGIPDPLKRLHVQKSGDVVAIFERDTSDGDIIQFFRDGAEVGDITVGGGTVTLTAFSGAHYAQTDEYIDKLMLVEMTGNNGYLFDDRPSEILYGITISTNENSPNILGSYLQYDKPNLASNPVQNEHHLVMAEGNGDMWIADQGEDIRIGDYLISSDVTGHAEKDIGIHLTSHIVARAMENINWDDITETFNEVKHAKISVTFDRFEKINYNKIIQDQQLQIEELKAIVCLDHPDTQVCSDKTNHSKTKPNKRG